MEAHEEHKPTRLPAAQRFERLVFAVAVVGLAATGMAQRFGQETAGHYALVLLGGIESARIIHRLLALLLIAQAVYHVLAVSYRRLVLGRRAALWPGWRDWRSLGQQVLSNLGLRRGSPADDGYAFRIRYGVLAVSVVILIVTGLILWNPVAVTNTLPGETIPTAHSIHRDHALLLVIFLVVWQILMLLVWRRPAVSAEPDAAPAAAGRGRWLPVAAVMLVLVAIMVWFLASDQTAINTTPRRQAVVFAPNMLPEAGDADVGGALWATLRCAFCHGEQGGGGASGDPALRGAPDLTLEAFYHQVRQGSATMPAFSREELPDGYLMHLWAWLTAAPATQ